MLGFVFQLVLWAFTSSAVCHGVGLGLAQFPVLRLLELSAEPQLLGGAGEPAHSQP